MSAEEQPKVGVLIALAAEIDMDAWEQAFSVNGKLIGGKDGIPATIAKAIRDLQRVGRAVERKPRDPAGMPVLFRNGGKPA